MTFEANLAAKVQTGIIFGAKDYLELVDITGRIIRKGKLRSIAHNLPTILERLHLGIDDWLIRTESFEQQYQILFAKYRLRQQRAA